MSEREREILTLQLTPSSANIHLYALTHPAREKCALAAAGYNNRYYVGEERHNESGEKSSNPPLVCVMCVCVIITVIAPKRGWDVIITTAAITLIIKLKGGRLIYKSGPRSHQTSSINEIACNSHEKVLKIHTQKCSLIKIILVLQ